MEIGQVKRRLAATQRERVYFGLCKLVPKHIEREWLKFKLIRMKFSKGIGCLRREIVWKSQCENAKVNCSTKLQWLCMRLAVQRLVKFSKFSKPADVLSCLVSLPFSFRKQTPALKFAVNCILIVV